MKIAFVIRVLSCILYIQSPDLLSLSVILFFNEVESIATGRNHLTSTFHVTLEYHLWRHPKEIMVYLAMKKSDNYKSFIFQIFPDFFIVLSSFLG